MSTPAQQSANQANAQNSSGPVTAAGKARSARNSRTHGLCAKDILVGPEDQAEFDLLAEQLRFDLWPSGALERVLYDEILAASWQLARVCRMETEACAGKDAYTDILDDEVLQKKLDRLARHHTRIERTFHRCLKQLKALQAQRKQDGGVTSDHLEAHWRRNPAGLAVISERSQSAAPDSIVDEDNEEPDYQPIITPEEFAEIDRDLDRMEAELLEQLRQQPKAA